MKKIIQILILLIFSSEIFACGGSFQYRLFPIGQEGQSIIAFETSLNRYWGPDTAGATIETRDRWKGVVSLIRIGNNIKPELIEIIDTIDILDRDYVKELKPYFDIALKKAQEIKDFVIAKNPEIEFCNFKIDCKTVDIIKDTNEIITVIGVNGGKYEIGYPKTVIDNSEASGEMVNQDFKMNSIRKVTIGKTELIIINFASGEDHNTNFEKQIENQKQCESIENSIYKEVTLYHGLAFDAIIWK
ncbi:MAG TPA: hypothetical protein VKZ45_11155 [Vicingaceae bacterium]|nr:hypothetical protein [Vicingaceae bacterium]